MSVQATARVPLDDEVMLASARALGLHPLPHESQQEFLQRVRALLNQRPEVLQAIRVTIQAEAFGPDRRKQLTKGLLWSLRIALALAGLYSVV